MKLRPLLLALVVAAFSGAAQADFLVLGGGCFWCLDASYRLLPGVTKVTCGYAGGTTSRPTYEEVCTEKTGHAEVVKVDYDPAKVSRARVLAYFWEAHNPTQVGGQGNDLGPSCRSIILYADDAQKAEAEKSQAEAQKRYRDPITTEIVPLKRFWPAESHHQDYFRKHPNEAYCALLIRPKVEKLKHLLETKK